jgi:hypothetical protein
MSADELLGELTPPGERFKSAGVDASILEAVELRKISYPAEIVGDTGVNRQTVFDHIRGLVKAGRLERVFLQRTVPEIMKNRLPELWEMGLKGAMIKRMSWYRVVDHGKGKKK